MSEQLGEETSFEDAVAVIMTLKKRAEDAERMVALAVLAAGGRVTIPHDLVTDIRPIVLTQERWDVDMSWRLRAVRG